MTEIVQQPIGKIVSKTEVNVAGSKQKLSRVVMGNTT